MRRDWFLASDRPISLLASDIQCLVNTLHLAPKLERFATFDDCIKESCSCFSHECIWIFVYIVYLSTCMIPQHDKVCSDWDVEQRITNSDHANQPEFDTDCVHPKLKQNKTQAVVGLSGPHHTFSPFTFQQNDTYQQTGLKMN